MKKSLLSVVLVTISSLSAAQDSNSFQCRSGELTRRIEVFYEAGVSVPCEVHYYKDTESPGEREVLWRAMNQEGYCESQAAAFVEKLEGMGWSCNAAVADDADTADDTDALAPAEEEIEIPEAETPEK